MKCVILAGGKGSRISELSKDIPKPMINVLGKPILIKIMQHYSNYGFNDSSKGDIKNQRKYI